MSVKFSGKATFSSDFFINGLSQENIRRAAARGLNEHARAQERNTINFLTGYTNQPKGVVQKAAKVIHAGAGGMMSAKVTMTAAAIPAGQYTGRSWSPGSAGASHRDWQGRTLPRTFTVKKWGGAIFQRQGKKRFPLWKIWGPVLPAELLQEDRPNIARMRAYMDRDLLPRVMGHVSRAIG